MAKKDAVCFDLGKAGVVQLLMEMWTKWEDDEMRQLILWAMNEVSRLGERQGTSPTSCATNRRNVRDACTLRKIAPINKKRRIFVSPRFTES